MKSKGLRRSRKSLCENGAPDRVCRGVSRDRERLGLPGMVLPATVLPAMVPPVTDHLVMGLLVADEDVFSSFGIPS